MSDFKLEAHFLICKMGAEVKILIKPVRIKGIVHVKSFAQHLVAVTPILLLLIIKFLAEPGLESRSPYCRTSVILKLHLDHIELLWVP